MYDGAILITILLALLNVQALSKDVIIPCMESNVDDKVQGGRCIAQPVSRYPWSHGKTRTAPAPQSLQAKFKVFKTPGSNSSRHIRLVIMWTQRDLTGVKGFHLELIHLDPPGSPRQYVMKFANLTSMTNLTTFFFNCCGIYGSYPVNPGDEYVLKVQALPMYQADDNPQALRANIIIPDCNNKVIRKTSTCKRKRRPIIADTTLGVAPSRSGFWNVLNYILVGVCGMVAVIMAAMIFFLCRKHIYIDPMKRADTALMNVLLVSTNDERFVDAVNALITTFQRFKQIEIVSNLRSKVEIGSCGIMDWVKDKTVEADLVLYLPAFEHEHIYVASGDEAKNQYQHIAVATSVAKSMILAQNMQNPRDKFLAVDLNNCIRREQLVFCTHFRLLADLGKLLKHTLGSRNGAVTHTEKSILKKLLINAQQNSSKKHTREKKWNVTASNNENNLDCSPFLSLPVGMRDDVNPPDGLNIVISDHVSMKCVEMGSYVTTDFND